MDVSAHKKIVGIFFVVCRYIISNCPHLVSATGDNLSTCETWCEESTKVRAPQSQAFKTFKFHALHSLPVVLPEDRTGYANRVVDATMYGMLVNMLEASTGAWKRPEVQVDVKFKVQNADGSPFTL
jgi:hypothetical protein